MAAENGIWMVLRNLEKAPPDLMTFLLPLVQENLLQVSANTTIRPKLGFRMIALCQDEANIEGLGIKPLIDAMNVIKLDKLRNN